MVISLLIISLFFSDQEVARRIIGINRLTEGIIIKRRNFLHLSCVRGRSSSPFRDWRDLDDVREPSQPADDDGFDFAALLKQYKSK